MSINVVAFVSTDLLPDATAAVFLGVLAANVGSFLNVVAYRVPRGESVVGGGSRCPACGSPVRWRDNIPVLGWLMLAGRCRDCRASIAPRYPLVETVAGLIGLVGAAELLSGGRTWPAGRFGTGRSGVDVLLMDADWGLALVCAAHVALLFVLLAWSLFERDRTRVAGRTWLLVGAALAALAIAAGGPTCAAGWPAAAEAAIGVGVAAVLGVAAPSVWLRQALGFVGLVLGWRALAGVVAIMAAVVAGRVAWGWCRGGRAGITPTCGDLLVATAVQLLAWRPLAEWTAWVWGG